MLQTNFHLQETHQAAQPVLCEIQNIWQLAHGNAQLGLRASKSLLQEI
uniref:Uncharacterized protein n=1 Tax=Arundo donax TaxID=35708 RepID=A0A0A8YHX7_ARUDO